MVPGIFPIPIEHYQQPEVKEVLGPAKSTCRSWHFHAGDRRNRSGPALLDMCPAHSRDRRSPGLGCAPTPCSPTGPIVAGSPQLLGDNFLQRVGRHLNLQRLAVLMHDFTLCDWPKDRFVNRYLDFDRRIQSPMPRQPGTNCEKPPGHRGAGCVPHTDHSATQQRHIGRAFAERPRMPDASIPP